MWCEEHGWRSGESVHLPPVWSGFDFVSVTYDLSFSLVLALFHGFLSGFSGFPPFIKTSISKRRFNQDKRPARKSTFFLTFNEWSHSTGLVESTFRRRSSDRRGYLVCFTNLVSRSFSFFDHESSENEISILPYSSESTAYIISSCKLFFTREALNYMYTYFKLSGLLCEWMWL